MPSHGNEEAFQDALRRALERLRRSDAFEAELRTLLEAKGFDQATVEKAMTWLRENRMLNDARVVEQALSKRSGSRARGADAIRAELLKRGAPEEEVDRQLALLSPESVQGQMQDLLTKKCKISDSRSKAARMLLSRGFDEDAVASALDTFFGSSEAWN